MTNLVLIIGLRDDATNTIASMTAYTDQRRTKALLGRDGVVLLSDNLVLLDQTKSHGALVQLCAALEEKSWPYLLVRMDGLASLASGAIPPAVAALLATACVPMIDQ